MVKRRDTGKAWVNTYEEFEEERSGRPRLKPFFGTPNQCTSYSVEYTREPFDLAAQIKKQQQRIINRHQRKQIHRIQNKKKHACKHRR